MKKANLPALAACLLALAALGVAGMAWFEAWANQPLESPVLGGPLGVADSAGVPLADGELRLDLVSLDEGGNTEAIWHCGKVLMGSRHDYTGAWGHLGAWPNWTTGVTNGTWQPLPSDAGKCLKN